MQNLQMNAIKTVLKASGEKLIVDGTHKIYGLVMKSKADVDAYRKHLNAIQTTVTIASDDEKKCQVGSFLAIGKTCYTIEAKEFSNLCSYKLYLSLRSANSAK